ncbi:Hypothetical protein, putative [Bodo saltans]|uniref:Uncharacterized protein n=1 Tax=Bodo saltans TaxID=75058 RepID=A0A0S4JBN9_BODSA|nr:Hypothetical protein, putative [Bodo saltans]|eukprot:CUG88922.1 Hypothetical protein, putative [Bodo saltans]
MTYQLSTRQATAGGSPSVGMVTTPRRTGATPLNNTAGGAGNFIGVALIPGTAPTNAATTQQLEELRVQVQFLERRNQYLQTVGALFRQKVAVIVRECARVSHMGPAELQQLYAATMDEIVKAENDMQSSEGQTASWGDQQGRGNSSHRDENDDIASALRPFQRSHEAKEDVRKAHLICVALQEKNDAKQREMELRREFNALTTKHDDLVDRHKKMLLLQSSSTNHINCASAVSSSAKPVDAGAVASMKELYESRIRDLEQTVVALKRETITLRTGGGGASGNSIGNATSTPRSANNIPPRQRMNRGGSYPRHSVDDDEDEPEIIILPEDSPQLLQQAALQDAIEPLTRQNQLLKARVNRLKDEVQQLKQQSLGSTMQLNEGLESLLAKISDQQRQLDERDTNILQLTREKRELAKECVAHRSQVDMYVKQLELFVKDADTSHLSSARIASHTKGETQSLSSAVDEYLQQIHQKDDVIRSLMQQLREEKQNHQERILEVRALGVQLLTFRTKLDAIQAQQQQRDQQQAMMSDMHSRLLSAVNCIQETQNTSSIASKLDVLSTKLRDMETVDLQLRQKEDELVIARDSLEQVREERDELLEALGSISAMFAQFPKSVTEVEKLVIQVEEFKAEIRRCAEDHSSPDMLRVEGRMELRLMELSNRKQQQQQPQHQQSSNQSQHQRRSTSVPRLQNGSHSSGNSPHTNHYEQQDDEDVWEAELEKQLADIMSIPPLVSLDDIRHKLQPPSSHGEPYRDAAHSTTPATLAAATPPPSHSSPQRSAAQSSAAAASGLGFLSPSGGPGTVQDVRLTFQLFDDHSTGVLPADLIALCLATLGIQRQLPKHVKEMSEDQFLAFCCGQLIE